MPPKNRIIIFRVTNDQFERILNNKTAYGHITIASYLRYLALEKSFFIDSKIVETNKLVKEILGKLDSGREKR